jgi:hypothetical protein
MILGYLQHIERNDLEVRAAHRKELFRDTCSTQKGMIFGYLQHIERNDFGIRAAQRKE